jgi:prepilin-type N-terminal cleavage/methylation domain-containing protein
MNTPNHQPKNHRLAFTLIEMLVVIAIIGILAGLLFTTVGPIKKKRLINLAQTELAQVQTAIEAYKTKKGFYPPDNPGNALINPLYFELEGTILTNNTFVTLDGSGQMAAPTPPGPPFPDFTAVFGGTTTLSGFANSSTSTRSTDDAQAATQFLKDLRPNQIGQLVYGSAPQGGNAILVCSIEWPDAATEPVPSSLLRPPPYTINLNPWRYVSTNPTNNAGTYDLWVDLSISGKTYRISNWKKEPQIF